MQKGLKLNGQTRALVTALGGAAVMSVVAMLIPASVFETITGSTGISELIPATGAPLGDTARALIAFGFGAVTFAILAAYLLARPTAARRNSRTAAPKAEAAQPVVEQAAAAVAGDDSPSFMDRMRAKISAFNENRRNGDDVKELSDLPKLRAGDAHPDAPPRRPISAHRDFGEIPGETASAEMAPEIVAEPVEVDVADVTPAILMVPEGAQPVASVAAPHIADEPVEQPVAHADTVVGTNVASLSAMVDRLEAAVALRQEQIGKLEAIASEQTEVAAPVSAVAQAETVEAEIIPPAPRPMSLGAMSEASAVKPSEADEMDAALRSALETLHRMNARTR